jgi:NB-ARC domain
VVTSFPAHTRHAARKYFGRLMGDYVDADLTHFVAQGSRASNAEKYTPACNTPAIPRGVRPDFSLDVDESPRSAEGQLKLAVMTSDLGYYPSAIEALIVGLTGMAGMGKTTALICICHDADVKRKYPDAVYFMTLGQDASPESVVAQLSQIVEESGGIELAGKVRACKKPYMAARKAGSWFVGRRCLFVWDDLRETASNPTGIFAVLRSFKEHSTGSCILFSTRNKTIASDASRYISVLRWRVNQLRAIRVDVSARASQGPEAMAMLSRHAGLSEEVLCDADDANCKSVQTVLEKCGGLPLALAVAGRTIGEFASRHSQTPPGAVRSLLSRLQRGSGRFMEESSESHPVLSSVLAASVEAASTHNPVTPTSGKLTVEKCRLRFVLCISRDGRLFRC